MFYKRFAISRDKILVGRLNKGDDLSLQLTKICEKEKISNAHIEGIGAVQCATIGYYMQDLQQYVWQSIDVPMEVLCLIGNVSIKDKKPFVHAHIVLADENGNAKGGHLGEKTKVFAFEYMIIPIEGSALNRTLDKDTGLFLWSNE